MQLYFEAQNCKNFLQESGFSLQDNNNGDVTALHFTFIFISASFDNVIALAKPIFLS